MTVCECMHVLVYYTLTSYGGFVGRNSPGRRSNPIGCWVGPSGGWLHPVWEAVEPFLLLLTEWGCWQIKSGFYWWLRERLTTVITDGCQRWLRTGKRWQKCKNWWSCALWLWGQAASWLYWFSMCSSAEGACDVVTPTAPWAGCCSPALCARMRWYHYLSINYV